jgi:hypothetical protein
MFSNADLGAANSVLSRRGTLVIASLLSAMAWACGGPPKQAEVPEVDRESGVDMANAAPEASATAAPATGADEGEAEMHKKCCVECAAGAAKDRTGAAKSTIPCADFTATLSPWCREHFLAHPAMASQCE